MFVVWAPARRASEASLCGKGGAQTTLVLRPWFFAWDQVFSGEAGHPAFAHGMWDQAPCMLHFMAWSRAESPSAGWSERYSPGEVS